MKLLSIAIPSYNSQDYMSHAIESLLPGGDEVEILTPPSVREAFRAQAQRTAQKNAPL